MCLDGTMVGSPPALLMASSGCMGFPTVPMGAPNATTAAGDMPAGLRRVPKYPPRRPLTWAIRAQAWAELEAAITATIQGQGASCGSSRRPRAAAVPPS